MNETRRPCRDPREKRRSAGPEEREREAFLGLEDAAMYQAAGLSQLPKMPNAQATVVQRLQTDAGPPDPAQPTGDVTIVTPCVCGCGQPISRAMTGRPGKYASGAYQMRAMLARGRAEAQSRA
jgi:hypothetical protein